MLPFADSSTCYLFYGFVVQPYEYTTRFYDRNLLGQGPFANALQGPPRFDFLRFFSYEYYDNKIVFQKYTGQLLLIC